MANSDDKLIQRLIDIVSKEAMIDPEKIHLDLPLANVDIQSADYVMILMAVEEEFGVYISVDEDFSEIKTVGDLTNLMVQKINEGKNPS